VGQVAVGCWARGVGVLHIVHFLLFTAWRCRLSFGSRIENFLGESSGVEMHGMNTPHAEAPRINVFRNLK
jgi:hypothetical protein